MAVASDQVWSPRRLERLVSRTRAAESESRASALVSAIQALQQACGRRLLPRVPVCHGRARPHQSSVDSASRRRFLVTSWVRTRAIERPSTRPPPTRRCLPLKLSRRDEGSALRQATFTDAPWEVALEHRSVPMMRTSTSDSSRCEGWADSRVAPPAATLLMTEASALTWLGSPHTHPGPPRLRPSRPPLHLPSHSRGRIRIRGLDGVLLSLAIPPRHKAVRVQSPPLVLVVAGSMRTL